MNTLSENMTRIYRRKVGAIKKSVYVNIPSKISKEIGIAKGSVLLVTLEDGRVVLSKGQVENGAITKQEQDMGSMCRSSAGTTSNNGNLKHLLQDDYAW